MELKRQLGVFTGILIIVADMIGTGIFMNTGFVLGMTGSALTVLVLWVLGGIAAITGSLCYAELATMWPDVGGEYTYLKKTFGFLPAFLTGWVSLFVGFSAPVATAALVLVQYLGKFLQNTAGTAALDGVWIQKIIAIAIIVIFSVVHIVGVKRGSYLQNILTVLKVVLVVSIIGFGLSLANWDRADRLVAEYPAQDGTTMMSLPLIGLGFLFVMFAYSGWNGATYIAGEIKEPGKNLPKILLGGTLITLVLYLLINVVFLVSSPGRELMGNETIGAIATKNLFGDAVGSFFALGIAIVLLSAVSVQMMIGPRVYYAMAKDNMMFQSLGRLHPRFETPALAIVIQMSLAIIYVLTGSAETLMKYMGFALNIFPVLTVIGMMYLRYREPGIARPFRVPLFPLVPLVYLALVITMMAAALFNWTITSLFAIGIVLAGIPVYYLWQRLLARKAARG
ncbi:MAG: amino acid permease [Spirochaetes bacterium]|nr:MAG: amino acid permease [Spirochaetota bacterium]